MKYKSVYPITCAEMDAQYRLTVDGVMTFHEDAVAKYLTTLNLDMNGHTNNRRYVAMALSCFDQEFQSSHRPDTLNIRFIKESRLGDTLTVASYPIEELDSASGVAAFLGQITNAAGDEICRVISHWTPKEPAHDMVASNPVRDA